MKSLLLTPTLILLVLGTLTSCIKQLTIENLYNKCKVKKELSILNYMVQFQVVENINSKQLVDLFDKEISKAESVDLCQCFVTKFKTHNEEIQKQTLLKVQTIDEQLNAELKIFAKNGVLGKFTNRDAYEKIESFIPNLPKVKLLIEEVSRAKFQQHACL